MCAAAPRERHSAVRNTRKRSVRSLTILHQSRTTPSAMRVCRYESVSAAEGPAVTARKNRVPDRNQEPGWFQREFGDCHRLSSKQ